MRLDVCERTVEQAARALDRELFCDVDILAAAVVAPAWIALGVFVGQDRTLSFENGAADDVFRGDQFDLVLLPFQLIVDRPRNFGVCFSQTLQEESLVKRPCRARCCCHFLTSFEAPPRVRTTVAVGGKP
jgi:hypothetical protein